MEDLEDLEEDLEDLEDLEEDLEEDNKKIL